MVVVYKNKDLNKLHNLQYQAMTSFEFKAVSVHKVVTNKGKKTPGVDNLI